MHKKDILRHNMIPVFSPYRIVESFDLSQSFEEKEWTKFAEGKGKIKYIVGTNFREVDGYNPMELDFFRLINECRKIDHTDEEQCINFCNKYGLPVGVDAGELNSYISKFKDREKIFYYRVTDTFGPIVAIPGGISIYRWKLKGFTLLTMRLLFGMNIANGSLSHLQSASLNATMSDYFKRFGWHWHSSRMIRKIDGDEGLVHIQPSFAMKLCDFQWWIGLIKELREDLKSFNREIVIDWNKMTELDWGFCHRVNYLLGGIELKIYPELSEDLNVKHWHILNSWLNIIGIAIYDMIFNDRRYETCIECKNDFITSRKNKKFCSDKCRNTYDKRVSRKRKRLGAFKNGHLQEG